MHRIIDVIIAIVVPLVLAIDAGVFYLWLDRVCREWLR